MNNMIIKSQIRLKSSLVSTICLYVFLLFLFFSGFLFAQVRDEPEITKQNIESAEILLGLEFSDEERDSMISELTELRAKYNEIRNFGLTNELPPAVQFNPIPIGRTFSAGKGEVILSAEKVVNLPERMEDLAFYSIAQLSELIKTRKISSVELTKFFLLRLKKYDPQIHCVITLTEERALNKAEIADREISEGNYRGPLHGIPFGAKDLLAVKGYKTTWGAMPYKEQYIDLNATVIRKLEEAGAILIAKLSMGALAWGDVWFGGKTRNPWNLEEGSSGSSAGSAAAVSAGLVPFAIGTETWGSIVSPATVCGVSGLRPTYGRVSRYGAMALSWTMDKIGPICRNIEDLVRVFDVIKGLDEKDQTLYDIPFSYNTETKIENLKIGYLKSDFETDYPFHKNDSLALAKLIEIGAELIPISLPEINVSAISFILSTESSAIFDDLTRSGQDDLMVRQIKNSWPNVFRSHRFVSAVEYLNANRIRHLLIQEMDKIFKRVDLFLAPSWDGDALLVTNLTGHPAVVVPTGSDRVGDRSSITFIGDLFEEGKILEAAKKYQDASGHHLEIPPIFRD